MAPPAAHVLDFFPQAGCPAVWSLRPLHPESPPFPLALQIRCPSIRTATDVPLAKPCDLCRSLVKTPFYGYGAAPAFPHLRSFPWCFKSQPWGLLEESGVSPQDDRGSFSVLSHHHTHRSVGLPFSISSKCRLSLSSVLCVDLAYHPNRQHGLSPSPQH